MTHDIVSMSIKECVSRARWYVAKIDALVLSFANTPRMDDDDRVQCQTMLREIKSRFGVDKTNCQANRESTASSILYHQKMLQAASRLTMATHSTPSAARWSEPLRACKADILAYLETVQNAEVA